VNILLTGDSNGNIHFIGLHPEFGTSTELGSKKKNQVLFAESLQVRLQCIPVF